MGDKIQLTGIHYNDWSMIDDYLRTRLLENFHANLVDIFDTHLYRSLWPITDWHRVVSLDLRLRKPYLPQRKEGKFILKDMDYYQSIAYKLGLIHWAKDICMSSRLPNSIISYMVDSLWDSLPDGSMGHHITIPVINNLKSICVIRI